MDSLKYLLLISAIARSYFIRAFVHHTTIPVPVKREFTSAHNAPAVRLCMSLDNFKDDIDINASSTSESEYPSELKRSKSASPRPRRPSSSSSSSYNSLNERPHRFEQIDSIQGVWWTSEQRDQLVEIRSSYAIFDAMQKTYVSSTSPMPPAVAYPLGGTDDIVTLRTFKLAVPSPIDSEICPRWIPSPTSKVTVQRGGGTAIGVESPSVQMVTPTPTTSFMWERCENPDAVWKSDRVVQGYEESLATLLASEGPHWSASPVDVLRACLKGVKSNQTDLVDALCRFSDPPPTAAGVNIGREHSNGEALLSIAGCFETGRSSWSIVRCHYFSPDVCTLRIALTNPGSSSSSNENEATEPKTFEFCLSREAKKPEPASQQDGEWSDQKMPVSNLFNSVMDVELLVSGKTWAIDHVHACSC